MQAENIFPVSNSTKSYWRSELHSIDSLRSTEQLPSSCDVLIIGAGMAGVSTAYHLLTDNPSPPSVVLLEAREICSGATGRNGGHCTVTRATIDSYIKKFGWEVAKELITFMRNHVTALKKISDKEKLDCDAMLTRYCEVYLSQSQADEAKQSYDAQVEAEREFFTDVNYIKPESVENVSGVKGAKAGFTTSAIQLWPYKFVTFLLARLTERTSINVQAHTPVSSVIVSTDGTSIITTPRGTILAKKVVFATNAYTAGISPLYARKIVPCRGICSHISTPQDTLHPPPHLNHTYGLNFVDKTRDYIVPRPDGGVICGGGRTLFAHDPKQWQNNWDDSTMIVPARSHFEDVMQENFRGWEESGASVDYLWTGIMGNTADGLPHVGQIPGRDNHYILAGFNGGGMSLIFLTAEGIAKMIRENAPFEESGIPRLYKTTLGRLERDGV